MVIKVYVALISCSQEIKKNQQRAIMILESKNISYSIIDITDPANEDSKDYMMETAAPKEGSKTPVTPQIYNDADYCGDYEGLDMANELDTLGDYLKLSEAEKKDIKIGITGIITGNKQEEPETTNASNGVSTSREGSPLKSPEEGISNVGISDPQNMEQSHILKDVTNGESNVEATDEGELVTETPVVEEAAASDEALPSNDEKVDDSSDIAVAETDPQADAQFEFPSDDKEMNIEETEETGLFQEEE